MIEIFWFVFLVVFVGFYVWFYAFHKPKPFQQTPDVAEEEQVIAWIAGVRGGWWDVSLASHYNCRQTFL